MRELQKEGKIGRIEVDLKRNEKRTEGMIKIPTALDQSETTLIAAAIETIERVGPCDAQITIEQIEDVRGSKREYIIERAKKLMNQISGSTDSREISKEIKESTKTSDVQEYGEGKLPCGDISEKELIVVEGRADVLNLLRAGVKNVIAMNGTKLPEEIRGLSLEKEITLFVDGDRGGKLIAQNVMDNARIKYIVTAPDGKEVEELTGKEILMNLRKRVDAKYFFSRRENVVEESEDSEELTGSEKEKLKEIYEQIKGSENAIVLNKKLEKIREVSSKSIGSSLKRIDEKVFAIVIDGIVTSSLIEAAEESNCKVIVAKNFATTNTEIKLLSF